MAKEKIDVVTGLRAQDVRALTVLSSLCSKGLMGTGEARAIAQMARVENVGQLCKNDKERKVLNNIANRLVIDMVRERKKHRKSRPIAAYYT